MQSKASQICISACGRVQPRIYIGEISHKGNAYPGEHKAIVDRELWESVRAKLAEAPLPMANDLSKRFNLQEMADALVGAIWTLRV